jgi:hypothetical protein
MTMLNQRQMEDLAARRHSGRCSTPHLAAVTAARQRDVTPIAAGVRDRGDVDLVGVESVDMGGADRIPAGRVEADRVEADRIPAVRVEADLVEAGRVEAERLIADLAALVDAGLVVVESHVLGPVRYAVGPNLDDAA